MMVPHGAKIFMATEPLDMRLGFGRFGLFIERMKREPRSRALFVLFGRRRQTAKVLSWYGTGARKQGRRTSPPSDPSAPEARPSDELRRFSEGFGLAPSAILIRMRS